MSEKGKVFVFDKKEIALIFLFMVLISVISFTLGVRIGKGLTYEKAGITVEDKELVALKSSQEEHADKLISENEKIGNIDSAITSDANSKLKEEFAKTVSQEGTVKSELKESVPAAPTAFHAEKSNLDSVNPVMESDDSAPIKTNPVVEKSDGASNIIVKEGSERNKYIGKYTIQVGSHPTLEEAKEFADGFTIRGYNPIINEVRIEGKGLWYRVSIGVFSRPEEAKEYIKKEESLFQGSNYMITEIK